MLLEFTNKRATLSWSTNATPIPKRRLFGGPRATGRAARESVPARFETAPCSFGVLCGIIYVLVTALTRRTDQIDHDLDHVGQVRYITI